MIGRWRWMNLLFALALALNSGCGSQSVDESGKISDEEMKRNIEKAQKAEAAAKSDQPPDPKE